MYKYNRDIILTDCDLKSEENFLEFIKSILYKNI